jgi:energy-converting hydrogenase Eha subunit E
MEQINITFGWCWMIVGVVAGMLIGLRAESVHWAGGYDSLKRRALRLAHISAIALSLLNIVYGYSLGEAELTETWKVAGSSLMILGALLMPLVCLGTAFFNPVKYLFPIPASAVGAALVIMAAGHVRSILA